MSWEVLVGVVIAIGAISAVAAAFPNTPVLKQINKVTGSLPFRIIYGVVSLAIGAYGIYSALGTTATQTAAGAGQASQAAAQTGAAAASGAQSAAAAQTVPTATTAAQSGQASGVLNALDAVGVSGVDPLISTPAALPAAGQPVAGSGLLSAAAPGAVTSMPSVFNAPGVVAPQVSGAVTSMPSVFNTPGVMAPQAAGAVTSMPSVFNQAAPAAVTPQAGASPTVPTAGSPVNQPVAPQPAVPQAPQTTPASVPSKQMQPNLPGKTPTGGEQSFLGKTWDAYMKLWEEKPLEAFFMTQTAGSMLTGMFQPDQIDVAEAQVEAQLKAKKEYEQWYRDNFLHKAGFGPGDRPIDLQGVFGRYGLLSRAQPPAQYGVANAS